MFHDGGRDGFDFVKDQFMQPSSPVYGSSEPFTFGNSHERNSNSSSNFQSFAHHAFSVESPYATTVPPSSYSLKEASKDHASFLASPSTFPSSLFATTPGKATPGAADGVSALKWMLQQQGLQLDVLQPPTPLNQQSKSAMATSVTKASQRKMPALTVQTNAPPVDKRPARATQAARAAAAAVAAAASSSMITGDHSGDSSPVDPHAKYRRRVQTQVEELRLVACPEVPDPTVNDVLVAAYLRFQLYTQQINDLQAQIARLKKRKKSLNKPKQQQQQNHGHSHGHQQLKGVRHFNAPKSCNMAGPGGSDPWVSFHSFLFHSSAAPQFVLSGCLQFVDCNDTFAAQFNSPVSFFVDHPLWEFLIETDVMELLHCVSASPVPVVRVLRFLCYGRLLMANCMMFCTYETEMLPIDGASPAPVVDLVHVIQLSCANVST